MCVCLCVFANHSALVEMWKYHRCASMYTQQSNHKVIAVTQMKLEITKKWWFFNGEREEEKKKNNNNKRSNTYEWKWKRISHWIEEKRSKKKNSCEILNKSHIMRLHQNESANGTDKGNEDKVLHAARKAWK